MSHRIRDDAPSVGRLSEPLRQALLADAAALRLGVHRSAAGATPGGGGTAPSPRNDSVASDSTA